MFLKFISFVIFLSTTSKVLAFERVANSSFSQNIHFYVYPENFPSFNLTGASSFRLNEFGCKPKEKFSIIVHGWLEDCETEWVENVIWALQEKRGGCIICMDLSHYSKNFNYFFFASQFPEVKKVLVDQLREMDEEGFDFDNGFMFGFSYGGHVALEAAIDFGKQRFQMIDVCERAGPGFNKALLHDPKLAAKHVQCIHTSNEMGMVERACHEEWSLGNCGNSQIAAGPYPKGSHGLCPHFYHSAFYNDFSAIKKPESCVSSMEANMPLTGIKMGYGENKSEVIGEFFAETSRDVPYNVILPVQSADEVIDEIQTTLPTVTTDAFVTETDTATDSTDNLIETTTSLEDDSTLEIVTVSVTEATSESEKTNEIS